MWWPGYVRLLQSKTLALKRQVFVEAARAVGTGRLRIVFVHILPNCVSPITVKASMDMGSAILAAAESRLHRPRRPAAVSRVGRDDQPRAQLSADLVVVLGVPGIFIYLTVLGFNLLGDGLRDILDPQSRG